LFLGNRRNLLDEIGCFLDGGNDGVDELTRPLRELDTAGRLLFWAICFIAVTVFLTAAPPSAASPAAFVAIVSVILARSLFCAIEAVICSIEALVSSAPAACSVAAWDKLCDVVLTSHSGRRRLP
jgi:hypothetical protein